MSRKFNTLQELYELLSRIGVAPYEIQNEAYQFILNEPNKRYIIEFFSELKKQSFPIYLLNAVQLEYLITKHHDLVSESVYEFGQFLNMVLFDTTHVWSPTFLYKIFTEPDNHDYIINIHNLQRLFILDVNLNAFDTKILEYIILNETFNLNRLISVYNAAMTCHISYVVKNPPLIYALLYTDCYINEDIIIKLIEEFAVVYEKSEDCGELFTNLLNEILPKLVENSDEIVNGRVALLFEEVKLIQPPLKCLLNSDALFYLITSKSPIQRGKLKEMSELYEEILQTMSILEPTDFEYILQMNFKLTYNRLLNAIKNRKCGHLIYDKSTGIYTVSDDLYLGDYSDFSESDADDALNSRKHKRRHIYRRRFQSPPDSTSMSSKCSQCSKCNQCYL